MNGEFAPVDAIRIL